MKKVKIRIKKSKNNFSWSNKFVGEAVVASVDVVYNVNISGGSRNVYIVKKSENPHLEFSPDFCSGFIEKEDADLLD